MAENLNMITVGNKNTWLKYLGQSMWLHRRLCRQDCVPAMGDLRPEIQLVLSMCPYLPQTVASRPNNPLMPIMMPLGRLNIPQ